MTPLERELRKKLAAVRRSHSHTMNAILPGGRGLIAKKHRAKLARLKTEGKRLMKQIEQLAEAPIEPTEVKPGRYRHYKGKEYEVVGIARHSETLEELVVYRALYGEHSLWVRPRKIFQESVVFEGRRVPRFEWVGAV
jgi:hypothetical protein